MRARRRDLLAAVLAAACLTGACTEPPPGGEAGAGPHDPIAVIERWNDTRNPHLAPWRPLLAATGAGQPDESPEHMTARRDPARRRAAGRPPASAVIYSTCLVVAAGWYALQALHITVASPPPLPAAADGPRRGLPRLLPHDRAPAMRRPPPRQRRLRRVLRPDRTNDEHHRTSVARPHVPARRHPVHHRPTHPGWAATASSTTPRRPEDAIRMQILPPCNSSTPSTDRARTRSLHAARRRECLGLGISSHAPRSARPLVTVVHIHRADLSGPRRRHGCRRMDRRRRDAHRRRHRLAAPVWALTLARATHERAHSSSG